MLKDKKPKISIVIAQYNTENEVDLCLNSIFESDFKDFEVIFVDDCSTDSSLKIAKKYPCRFFSTKQNSGSATARNLGVRHAKSDIIMFLDSDTKVEKDSLKKIYQTFVNQPEIWAVIALPNIISLRQSSASHYNALRNHYTLISTDPYTNYFTTQMGAIRKKMFEKLGGFNEDLKSADKRYGYHALDDIELGPRIPEGKVYINKEVIIGHHFPYLKSILKKYYKRAIMLTHVFKGRKKLSKTHANLRGMVLVMIVLLNFLLLFLSFLNPAFFLLFLMTFFIFFFMNFGLFNFAIRKRGISYIFPSIFFEYVFSLAIGFGGIVGNIKKSKTNNKLKEKKFEKYFRLLRGLFSKHPTYIIFYITALCNSQCKMCFNWKYINNTTKQELNLEEIDKISKKLGYLQYVTLGGGEPYLRKDFDKICRIFYVNNKARIFSIPTNCLTPKIIKEKTENALKLCPEAVFRVSMSIDGIGNDHDQIRGVNGNFEKVKETYTVLNELRKKYPRLEILANTTFTFYNQDKIKELHDYIRKNFKLDMYGLTLVRGNSRELIAKEVDFEKYKQAVNIFEEYYFKNKGEQRHIFQRILTILPIFTRREVIRTAKAKKRIYTCHAIKKMVVIDSFGNVYACEMLPNKLGNLREENYDIKSILNKNETKRLLKFIKNKKCNCTWECAIQNSLVFNYRNYPKYLKCGFN